LREFDVGPDTHQLVLVREVDEINKDIVSDDPFTSELVFPIKLLTGLVEHKFVYFLLRDPDGGPDLIFVEKLLSEESGAGFQKISGQLCNFELVVGDMHC
jgi:hypothetical protein